MKISIFFFYYFFAFYVNLNAQIETRQGFSDFRIGQPYPNYIFDNLQYYPKGRVSTSDFKGKWLVLDFWNNGCIACIESFPLVDAIAQEFAKNVQFIFVGAIGREFTINATRSLYEKCRVRFNLHIPVVYDSILFDRFNAGGCPFIVVISPNGNLKAFTSHLTMEDMTEFCAGKDPVLANAYFKNQSKIPININVPFLAFGNGARDTDVIYGSILSKWNNSIPNIGRNNLFDPKSDIGRKYKFELLQTTVPELYRFAFFGKGKWFDPRDSGYYDTYSFQPILHIRDTSLFQAPDVYTGKNLFSYSLIVPSDSVSSIFLQRTLQADLRRYFGYNVSIETKSMPYLRLVASVEARNRLKTKGSPVFVQGEEYMNWPNAKHMQPIARHQGFVAKNIPITWLIIAISGASEIPEGRPPIINETQIQGNIDITIDALIFDLFDVRRALQKNGLDLIEGVMPMKVLVIKN